MAKRSSSSAATRIPAPGPSAIPNARDGILKVQPGESRMMDPTVTPWNEHAPVGEAPPEQDRQADAAAGTGAPIATGAGGDDEKQAKIRELLGRQITQADDDTGAAETPAGDATAAAAETETTPPAGAAPAETSRRDRLGNLDARVAAERAKLDIERQLGEERRKRQEAEAALSGDLLSIARAKGITRDQALDLLMADPATLPDKPPEKPSTDPALNDRVAKLEQREAEINRREAMTIVERLTEKMDIPVVRATRRVTVESSDGKTEVMSGLELVHATARRLWEQDGSPAGQQHAYVAKAAPLVEEQLIEDQRGVLEAYAAKRGAPAAAATPPKKPTPAPSVGKRTGGAAPRAGSNEALPANLEAEERREAVKARFGWT